MAGNESLGSFSGLLYVCAQTTAMPSASWVPGLLDSQNMLFFKACMDVSLILKLLWMIYCLFPAVISSGSNDVN